MNILQLSRTMGQGGAEKVVFQISKELSKNNNVYVASTGGIFEEKLENIGVKCIKIPDMNSKNIFLIIKTLITLFSIIKKYDIQIIHSHHRMAAFYSRLIKCFYKNIKTIYTAHNVFYNKKKLLRFSLKDSKIIAVGDSVKTNLIDVYGLNGKEIKVIYNSIEKKENGEKPCDEIFLHRENKILIGNIGRLNEQKGIDIFIKAISDIIKYNKNVIGIIVGEGKEELKLKELVKVLNIEKNIKFLGFRTDVTEIIEQLDFIVLSSRWEGLPLTIIETFMMKKTMIASNINGNNEIIKDGYNGLLFEKDNIKELSEKINMIIHDNKLRNKLSDNARKTYNEKFIYSKFIEDYKALYK